jgi:hypothetical protein
MHAKKSEIEPIGRRLDGVLNRVGWLLTKFASHQKLKEKINEKQSVIEIPTQYAQLAEGNQIAGLQLYHTEKSGNTWLNIYDSSKQKTQVNYVLRFWIYVTADGSIGYVESTEIENQQNCSWQHNIWHLNQDQKFQITREEEHSVPGMTRLVLKGLLTERLGFNFEREANQVVEQFLNS